jgi:hypothetical protein
VGGATGAKGGVGLPAPEYIAGSGEEELLTLLLLLVVVLLLLLLVSATRLHLANIADGGGEVPSPKMADRAAAAAAA